MNVHAVGADAVSIPGRCCWLWLYSGACLRCEDNVIPGEIFCSDHYIEAVAGPFPVEIPEVTQP